LTGLANGYSLDMEKVGLDGVNIDPIKAANEDTKVVLPAPIGASISIT
jgi:hypothetical protein